MSMDQVKDAIRQFILSSCLQGESPDTLKNDTPLVTSGILDSLGSVGLITFLEQRFNIELDVYDTSVEHFDRIDDIAETVIRKLQTPAA